MDCDRIRLASVPHPTYHSDALVERGRIVDSYGHDDLTRQTQEKAFVALLPFQYPFRMTLTNVTTWILVGALWGCTNPFLRKGLTKPETKQCQQDAPPTQKRINIGSKILHALSMFRYIRVWLPYLLNQSGSILYYKVLADSNLTLAVPICNSLTLLFSVMTSFALGERVDKPVRAILGAALVMSGVGFCVSDNYKSADKNNRDEEL